MLNTLKAPKLRVRLVDSIASAEAVLPTLLGSKFLAFDCEGSNLSRWGKLSLMQFRSSHEAVVCDAMVPGVIETLRPVLESETVVKITHDCREDASALYHPTGTKLKGVFDLQIGGWLLGLRDGLVSHNLVNTEVGLDSVDSSFTSSILSADPTSIIESPAHLPSLAALRETLSITNQKISNLKSAVTLRMDKEPELWLKRPVEKELVKYAISDVVDLIDIMTALQERLSQAEWGEFTTGKMVQNYLAYPYINQHIRWPGAALKTGLKLKGMITASTGSSLILKLNCGKTGVVSGPKNLAEFRSNKIGDYVDCFVSSWDAIEKTLFLQRLNW